ncbi:uncharacterized protein LOC112981583 [Dromaius novaehollandiae]|uniref:uncharacterized protein LOC112981583 n=1 Tax=Dromaius novaehollandiae TaxID=8790 RepID=UPI00311D308A
MYPESKLHANENSVALKKHTEKYMSVGLRTAFSPPYSHGIPERTTEYGFAGAYIHLHTLHIHLRELSESSQGCGGDGVDITRLSWGSGLRLWKVWVNEGTLLGCLESSLRDRSRDGKPWRPLPIISVACESKKKAPASAQHLVLLSGSGVDPLRENEARTLGLINFYGSGDVAKAMSGLPSTHLACPTLARPTGSQLVLALAVGGPSPGGRSRPGGATAGKRPDPTSPKEKPKQYCSCPKAEPEGERDLA